MDKVYTIMTHPELEQPAPVTTTPAQPKKYPFIPSVRVGSVAGLLELLENRQDEDLYRLEKELQLEANDILPIIGAARLIGFIEIQAGDIHLNPIAYQFIQSDIDERKQIIRTLLLVNVELVQKIDHLLNSAPSHRLAEALILDLLTNHFSPQEAEQQLNTAIAWGRYAGLFSYDEPSGELFLERSVELVVNSV